MQFIPLLEVQDILTPIQETWLDAGPVLQPWCVNMWALTEALAAEHGLPQVSLAVGVCAVTNHVWRSARLRLLYSRLRL